MRSDSNMETGKSMSTADHVGRSKVYKSGVVSEAQAFFEFSEMLQACDQNPKVTRVSYRTLSVPRPHEDVEYPHLDGWAQLEVNAVPLNDSDQKLLWISKNKMVRAPSEEYMKNFGKKIYSLLDYEYKTNFNLASQELIDSAVSKKWKLRCNDPKAEWGTNQVHGDLFPALLRHLFYFDNETAIAMLHNEGYSADGHYVFSMENEWAQTLCVFVLAEFPWGFEGTYTMVNPTMSFREVNGAARLLMLLANSLVLSRHGEKTLLYGEANKSNIKAFLHAGYRICPPQIDPSASVHSNIVWRDNPIGNYDRGDEYRPTPVPPSHYEKEYADYAVMRADNLQIIPYIDDALRLLLP